MKILVIHNSYQIRGGEEEVVRNEIELLRMHGQDVTTWLVSNDSIRGLWGKVSAAAGAVFSISAYISALQILRGNRPDVVHVHNFFPLLSPSIFYACRRARIPVVMTLHNYRIVCPTANLSYGGEITERSLAAGPWWAVGRGVYRGSRLASLSVAAMISLHRWMGTWASRVDCLIALSSFAREKFVEAGIPPARLVVKPNFVPALAGADQVERRDFLYAGRLSSEKGIEVLLSAIESQEVTLRIAGDGPVPVEPSKNVVVLGRLGRSELSREMFRAVAVVVPSTCYEMFPLVVLEAFASGTPVIASRLGVLGQIVEEGVTGLLFDPGEPLDLRRKLEWAVQNPQRMREMGVAARAVWQEKYSPERNLRLLIEIYEAVIAAGRAAIDRSGQ